MRIAIIAPPWVPVPPPAYGGTELVLDALARGLAGSGHEVLLCTTGDSTCPVARSWLYDAALGTHEARPAAELAHVIDAYAAAARWGAELVHDHTITGLAWGSRSNSPVVTTNHGPFSGDLAAIYRHTAARVPIVAISHHQASTAGEVPVATVIHHGIDLHRHRPGRGDGGYVCFLGRMSPDKGVHTAIDVARRVGVPLLVAAKMREAPEHAYFEAEIRGRLGAGVDYLGELRTQDKADLLAGATCLLNPIAWPEPFGLVMVEALAHGTPVVATPCGAAPEIIQDGVTGFLRDNPDELAEALGRISTIDRTRCRASAEEQFSLTRMATDHSVFYAAVLEGCAPEAVTTPGPSS